MMNNFCKKLPALAATALLAWCAGHAYGAVIVDQSQTTGFDASVSIIGTSPAGQSFTPDESGIDFATFKLRDSGGAGGTLAVELHAGNDGSGTLLGTSLAVTLPVGFGGATGSDVQFDFASTLALTPGSLYSLIFVLTAVDMDFFGTADSNAYLAGDAILGGATIGGGDAYFIEGINSNSAAVAEPGSLALLAVVLGAFGLTRRKA